jgi:molybdenum cofactor cytidylyltransferase
MKAENFSYGIIILAAGNSSRLGQSKQLLPYQDRTLIEHVVRHAQGIDDAVTVVVTGAFEEALRAKIARTGVLFCHNADWAQGMSTSIRAGLAYLQDISPTINACILSVCDQPYLSKAVFEQLIQRHKTTSCEIVASSYGDTIGTPVLFNKRYFIDLQMLQGQEGAKKILIKYETNVCLLPFPRGEIDIDTMKDYVNLLSED